LPEESLTRLYYEDDNIGNSYEMKFLNNPIMIVDPLLFNALSQLKENKRQIILLFYFCGFNDREIAELNHMSISGIWYQRQMAIKEMRQYFEKRYYE